MKENYFKNSMKAAGLLALTFFLSGCEKMIIFNSKGPIGQKESQLIITAFVLMLIVVIPVFVMVILFSKKYRASNKNLDYRPDWHDSKKVEWVIWSIPVAIIIVLAALTWKYTHELDPYRPIKHELPALQVEVISTTWLPTSSIYCRTCSDASWKQKDTNVTVADCMKQKIQSVPASSLTPACPAQVHGAS